MIQEPKQGNTIAEGLAKYLLTKESLQKEFNGLAESPDQLQEAINPFDLLDLNNPEEQAKALQLVEKQVLDKMAWLKELYNKHKDQPVEYLYHITPAENVDSILENGLTPNSSGDLYYLISGDERLVRDLTRNQLAPSGTFALFLVNAATLEEDTELINDEVAELTSWFQVKVRQGIEPWDIDLLGYFNI